MIAESIRPMNDLERKALESWIANEAAPKGFAKSLWSGLGLVGLALALLVLFFGWILPGDPPMWIVVPVAVFCFFCGLGCFFFGGNMIFGAMRMRSYRKRAILEGNPRIKAALDDGKVKVLSVTASSVVFFEQFEDEGDGYLFEAGPTSCVIFKDQESYPADERMPWPARHFEFITTAESDIRIGLFSSGELLTPRLTIPLAETCEDFVWDARLEVLNKSADEVLRGLLKPNSKFQTS